jgi:hypothetical protein
LREHAPKHVAKKGIIRAVAERKLQLLEERGGGAPSALPAQSEGAPLVNEQHTTTVQAEQPQHGPELSAGESLCQGSAHIARAPHTTNKNRRGGFARVCGGETVLDTCVYYA